MERGAIRESARQRKETEPAPPLSISISHLYLSSPDSVLLHPGYGTHIVKHQGTHVVVFSPTQPRSQASLATTNSEAITHALEEVVTNKEVEASLRELIRKGRGRFVDVYQEPQ
jgi:hypothetical protein